MGFLEAAIDVLNATELLASPICDICPDFGHVAANKTSARQGVLQSWHGSGFAGKVTEAVRQSRSYADSSVLARHDLIQTMTAETLIRLLEEMMDIKIQRYAQYHLKLNPEVAKILMEKRETDRRRLDQIRVELVRFLDS